MGGYGSGRRWSTKHKVDEGLRLDINKLKRDGLILPNMCSRGILTWTRTNTGEKTGSVNYELNTTDPDSMWMRLYYTHTPYHSDESEERDYRIGITTTKPYFGGKRLWFLCPLTHRKTPVLYAPPGSRWFASRHAFNMKYQSQSRGPHDRAIDKLWKLKNRLGGERYWEKPKGMHNKTYERKLEEIWAAEEVCDNYLAVYVKGRF